MKIGIFDPYLDTLGGGEKYMLTAAVCLARKHEVSLFWDPSLTSKTKEKTKQKFDLDLMRIRFVSNVFTRNTSLTERLLVTRAYDTIIYLSDGSIPLLFAKKNILHFQFPTPWVHGRSIITKLKMARIDEVVCNSFFTKKYIDEIFGIQSRVVYPPAEILGKEGIMKKNIILNVGRFGRLPEGKNFKKQDILIETFKEMVNEGLSGWDFILVVSVREEDKQLVGELEKMSKDYPIEIIKNADNSTVRKFYQEAKIYWHATGCEENLVKHPERAEHFGISTVEAMGAGVVPVVINAGGQPEIVDNGANGFLWNSLEELKDRTISLIHNRREWERLSKSAQKKAKAFSKERFCREIYELITE